MVEGVCEFCGIKINGKHETMIPIKCKACVNYSEDDFGFVSTYVFLLCKSFHKTIPESWKIVFKRTHSKNYGEALWSGFSRRDIDEQLSILGNWRESAFKHGFRGFFHESG